MVPVERVGGMLRDTGIEAKGGGGEKRGGYVGAWLESPLLVVKTPPNLLKLKKTQKKTTKTKHKKTKRKTKKHK